MGLRRFFPETFTIGAQLFLHLPLALSLRPSGQEEKQKIIPQLFLETSQGQCEIAGSFNEDVPFRPAPALRYVHMFNDQGDEVTGLEKAKHVLVALPSKVYASVELLEMVNRAAGSLPAGTRIFVRHHPDCGMDQIIKSFGAGRWPAYFEWSMGSLPEVLKEVAVMVAFPSNIVIEASIKGLPVVFVYGQTLLDQNPLRDFKLEWVEDCYSSLEVSQALGRLLHVTQKERIMFREKGRNLREYFFTPVNEQNMRIFIEDQPTRK